jgi:hypothetical protein
VLSFLKSGTPFLWDNINVLVANHLHIFVYIWERMYKLPNILIFKKMCADLDRTKARKPFYFHLWKNFYKDQVVLTFLPFGNHVVSHFQAMKKFTK